MKPFLAGALASVAYLVFWYYFDRLPRFVSFFRYRIQRTGDSDRWPFQAAWNGALLTGAFVVAVVLLASSRPTPSPDTTVEHRAIIDRLTRLDDRIDKLDAFVREKPNQTSLRVEGAESNNTAWWVALLAAVLGGALLLFNRTSESSNAKTLRSLGAGLAVTGGILSGAKALAVDKLFSTSSLSLALVSYTPYYSVGQDGSQADQRSAAEETDLPAFATGTADSCDLLTAGLQAVSGALKKHSGISQIVVVGRADRRELHGAAQINYKTNWSLAQQRAERIRKILTDDGVSGPILVENAGPLLTREADDEKLSRDRRTTIQVYHEGTPWSKDRLPAAGSDCPDPKPGPS